MTQSLRMLIIMTMLSLTGLLSTACSSSRPPVAMVEPSYSHMRDVQTAADPAMASDQYPASELTRQPETTAPAQDNTPSVDPTMDNLDPMSSQLIDPSDSTLMDQLQSMHEAEASDYFFEMARLAPNQP